MTGIPSGSFECWIPHQWEFEHPWKQYQRIYPDLPAELKSFTFTHIGHATHTQAKDGIVQKEGLEAKQSVIERRPGYSFQMLGSEPQQLREDKTFPGFYVFFAPIIPYLDIEHKQACLTLTERCGWGVGGTEFSDYIDNHSRFGNWMFSMTIDEALELYKYSVEQEMKGRKVEEIKFKLMGTKRYKYSVAYIVAVTARLEGEEKDPLHEYQDWNEHPIASLVKGSDVPDESDCETEDEQSDSELPPPRKKIKTRESQGSHDQEEPSHHKIVFNPKAVVCIKEQRCFTKDYIEIAFHFRNQDSIFHLKNSRLDLRQPEQVFHHKCVRSHNRHCAHGEGRPEEEWKTKQEERFQ